MEKLAEVEAARALMTEAMAWSVMKWLREKKRVRRTADQANAALDQLTGAVRQRWVDGVRVAYEALAAQANGAASRRQGEQPSQPVDGDAIVIARSVKQADDEAYRARMDAEETFDEAERQLSTSLALEGCRKAIHSWDLHEKAIRRAEAVCGSK